MHKTGGAHVVVEVLALEAWIAGAVEVAFRVVLCPLGTAGQEAAAQRAERHQAGSELLEQRQDTRLQLTLPQRIFALEGGDGVDGMGAPDCGRPCFREAEETHLSLGDQLAHRACYLLDRHVGIDAVLIEEVDPVRPESPQRRVGHLPDVLRTTIDRWSVAAAGLEAELCRDGQPTTATPGCRLPG